MKKFIYLFLVCFFVSKVCSQGLTQSAEGKSTILLKGSAINIDIGKAELSFGCNNLLRSVGADRKFIWGVNTSAKNEEGIGNLFSNGDLVPAGSLNGLLGFSISNGKPSINLIESENKLNNFQQESEKCFYNKMKITIYKYLSDDLNKKELTLLRDTMLICLNSDMLSINSFDKLLIINEKDSTYLIQTKENIKKDVETFKNEYYRVKNNLNKEISDLSNIYGTKTYYQFIIFCFGGIDAMNFKHFTHLDSTNLNKSFDNVYFRGGKAGLGFNLQYGFFRCGATYSYTKTNNFKLLNNKTYTLKQVTTIGNQSLTNEKSISSYVGTYDEVEINELNCDMIFNIKLPETDSSHILFNPYIRAQFFSRNENLLPNKLDVGAGLYFVRQTGKLSGGIYLELPDVNNNYERAKPVSEQDLREFFKRLSFGVVGKYSFNSILDLF
jgi:hypothetical protein